MGRRLGIFVSCLLIAGSSNAQEIVRSGFCAKIQKGEYSVEAYQAIAFALFPGKGADFESCEPIYENLKQRQALVIPVGAHENSPRLRDLSILSEFSHYEVLSLDSQDLKDISILNGVATIKASAAFKNEIYIKKQAILKDLSQRLRGTVIYDIK